MVVDFFFLSHPEYKVSSSSSHKPARVYECNIFFFVLAKVTVTHYWAWREPS